MVDVSILIVAWNVKKLVYDCLKSVYDQTDGISFEVIFVDNASQDGTVEMVKKEFPAVRILENDENKGFIRANNQGIEIAQGRYVLLLNSDTIVLENAIAKTVLFADEHPDAGVVGCRVLNADRSLQRNCFVAYSTLNLFFSAFYLSSLFPNNPLFGRARMGGWNFDDVREVDTVCGCFSLVRKKALDQIGVMDELFFTYGDDGDWCHRFRKGGWKVMFTPEPQIIHLGGATTRQSANKFTLQGWGSLLLFVKKHRSWSTFLAARFLSALFMFLRLPYWIIAGILRPSLRKDAFQTVWTYFIGGFFSLFAWENLLMNKEEVRKKLKTL